MSMTRRERAGWIFAVVILLIVIAISGIQLYLEVERPRYIAEGIISADIELERTKAHRYEIQERVVRVREDIARDTLGISGDDLIYVALVRAERYRDALRRSSASRDIQSADRGSRDE